MTESITARGRLTVFAAAFFLFATLAAPAVAADGLRNITAATFDYYFDDTFRCTVEDVFLARFCPAFSLQVKPSFSATETGSEYVLSLGPVINFSGHVYLDAIYGLGFDSSFRIEHRAEVNLHYEDKAGYLGVGARGAYFPDTNFFFIIPSVEGKIRPLDWLALFGKLFFGWNSLNMPSGSFWGELYWITGPAVTIRTGGTVSHAGAFGYSLLAGVDIRFSPAVLLRYFFQFLADAPDENLARVNGYGIENGLFLDVRL
ncbi:MAG: hypothetical protein JXD23_06290 [Spirochaetales bacterium]|nr:hypothetical protein [Spirochaetales bacterium]